MILCFSNWKTKKLQGRGPKVAYFEKRRIKKIGFKNGGLKMNSDIFWGTKTIFNPKINGQRKKLQNRNIYDVLYNYCSRQLRLHRNRMLSLDFMAVVQGTKEGVQIINAKREAQVYGSGSGFLFGWTIQESVLILTCIIIFKSD